MLNIQQKIKMEMNILLKAEEGEIDFSNSEILFF